jgi:hypothetical protein
VTCFTLVRLKPTTRRQPLAPHSSRKSAAARRAETAVRRKHATRHGCRHRRQAVDLSSAAGRGRLVADIKEQLGHEMGLLPVRLIRERQASFVELYITTIAGNATTAPRDTSASTSSP